MTDGKAEPGTLALLGSEKRIEDALLGLPRDSDAIVANRNYDVTRIVVLRGHRNDPTPILGDGLGGVDQQVDEHLRQPRFVGQDRRHRLEISLDVGLLPDLVHCHSECGLEAVGHLHRTAFCGARPRERFHVGDQSAHALRTVFGVLQQLFQLRRRNVGPSQLQQRKVQTADHVGERIVDLVCHPGRQRSDAHQAFGHGSLPFGLKAIAHVARDDENFVVPQGNDARFVVAHHALVLHGVLETLNLPAI